MKILVRFLVGCFLIGEVFSFSYSPLIAPRSEEVNPSCRLQSDAYVKSVANFTLWAVEMYDASAKLPHGILSANVYHMGNFDQCLRVHVDLGPQNGGEVDGKYCLVKLQLGTTEPHSPPRTDLHMDPFQSAREKIQSAGEFTIWRRDQIYWGICVPAVCTEEEIIAEAERIFQNESNFKIAVSVNSSTCQTAVSIDEASTFSPLLDNLTIALFVFLILLAATSTIYDYYLHNEDNEEKSPGFLTEMFLCFSLKTSVPSCVSPKMFDTPFDFLTGSRTFLTILVMYGHRWRINVIAPLIDATTFETKAREFNFMTTCLIMVNSFFNISGFIIGYFFYSELEKREQNGTLHPRIIISAIIFRILRFTPLYAVVILLNLTLLPKLNSGPLWPSTVLREVERCKESWWTNLLYINNYYLTEKMCMFQSWYLSTDMQLFAASLAILYIYKKNKNLGNAISGLLITGSVVLHGILLYVRDDPAYLQVGEQRMRLVPNEYYYHSYYIPAHFRIASYLIGIYGGIKTWEWKDIPTNMSKMQVNLCTAFIVLFKIGILLLGNMFTIPTNLRSSALARSLYGALHCPLWAFSGSILLILIFRKPGGIIEKIGSFYPLIFLSKFSFAAYFVHSIFHSVEYGHIRTPNHSSRYYEYWMALGDLFFANLSAFILCVLVEIPFSKIQKLIFMGEKGDLLVLYWEHETLRLGVNTSITEQNVGRSSINFING